MNVQQQNPETGEWEPATPLNPKPPRHWPWLQRLVNWLWKVKTKS